MRKVHAELARQGHQVAGCTVHRLMKQADLSGICRTEGVRTTTPVRGTDLRPDSVEPRFCAGAPNRLWVADIT